MREGRKFHCIPFCALFYFSLLGEGFPVHVSNFSLPSHWWSWRALFCVLSFPCQSFSLRGGEVVLATGLVLCVRQMIFSLLSHFGRWQSRDCFLFLLVLLSAPVLCVCDSLGSQVLFVWGAQSHCGMSLPPDMGEENSCAALCTAFIHRTMVSVEHETVLADTDLFCLLDTKKRMHRHPPLLCTCKQDHTRSDTPHGKHSCEYVVLPVPGL